MLLDTHALLWVLDGCARFGPVARRTLERGSDVAFSPVSIAEIRIKQMLGKLTVPADLLDRIEAAGLRPTPLGVRAADGLTRRPTLSRHDPFDRLLISQAVADDTVLVTADQVLLGLSGAPVLDART